jgi:hypothetical protein
MSIYKEYQPLRISSDWKITLNCFFEIDPSTETMSYFAENLLFLNSERRNRSIELQWKPEDDPTGEYVLKVINLYEEYSEVTKKVHQIGDFGKPHLSFRSKSRIEIVEKIEYLMFSLDEYKDERILKSRGVVDVKLEALRIEFLANGYSKNIANQLINSNNHILQNSLLDNKNIDKENIIYLSEYGVKKGIKNKAKQLLKNKRFR